MLSGALFLSQPDLNKTVGTLMFNEASAVSTNVSIEKREVITPARTFLSDFTLFNIRKRDGD